MTYCKESLLFSFPSLSLSFPLSLPFSPSLLHSPSPLPLSLLPIWFPETEFPVVTQAGLEFTL